jgi:signal transduction histidine kinase
MTADRHERERLATLHALGILDTPPEERFDRIARLAARLLGAPTALITFVDQDRQWFKARVGFDRPETPVEVSFCAHAIRETGPLVVPDARADPRFAGNPLVTGAPHIRAYAGQPIAARDGQPVGTLCVIHPEPRNLSAEDLATLADLAAWVELELAAGETSRALLARRDRELRLGALMEVVVEGVLVLDAEGRVEMANTAAAELLGRRREDLVDESADALLAAAPRPLATREAPVGSGRVLSLVDRSEEARLREMQDRFLSVASHELNNPLTMIKGYAEELLDPATGALTPVQRSDVETILKGAQRLEEVAGDATLALRIASGRLPGAPESIATTDLLAAAARQVAQRAAEAGVVLQLDSPAALVVHGYPDVLRVALARLLADAVAASPRGATVIASAALNGGGEVVLRVRDGRGGGAAADRSATLARRVAEHHGGHFEDDAGATLVVPGEIQPAGGR